MRNKKILRIHLLRILSKIFIFSLITIFLFKLISVQKQNIKKQKELEEYEKRLNDKILENKRLKKKVDEDLTDEYKEKYARENLDMTKKGERIIYDVSKQ